MMPNQHIRIGSSSYEKVKTIKCVSSLLENQNHKERKCRLKVGNSCYYLAQTLLSSRLFPKNFKICIYIKVAKRVCYSVYNLRTAVPMLMIFLILDSSQAPITE